MYKTFLCAGVFFGTVLFLFGCTDNQSVTPERDKINIGFLVELESSDFQLDAMIFYRSALLAVDEINAGGGIDGKDLNLVLKNSFDNTPTNVAAVGAATDCYNQGMRCIIGSGWSGNTMAIAKQVTIPNNMLLISFSATSPLISDMVDKGLVWRTVASDAYQGSIAARYITQDLNKTTMSILYRNDTYGIGLKNVLCQSFIASGGTILDTIGYPTNEDLKLYNFSPKLDTLVRNHPQVIFTCSYDDDQIKILKDIGFNTIFLQDLPLIFRPEGLKGDIFIKEADPRVANKLYSVQHLADTTAQNYTTFLNNYIAKFGGTRGLTTAYDCVYLLAYAMLKAQTTTDAVQIAGQMRGVSGGASNATVINVNNFSTAKSALSTGGNIDYNGASGKIEYDANGDITACLFSVERVVNLQSTIVKIISIP